MKQVYGLLAAVLILVLSACGGQVVPVVEEPEQEAVVEEVVEQEPEPTEAPAETSTAGPEKLDVIFGTMLGSMSGYNALKADGLLEEMTLDAPPFILDVRSLEEVAESGHIEGAAHIPLNELAQHADLLPSLDTPIV
ncbi:MAG TPA: rhodanese-like domain-containing protein, partial [Chloroflexi bacterium]|nr:rhodanese-like domain-containing protein [Chloroflexota bacterium]